MGTKEGMVTAPVIIFLYDFAFLSGSFATTWRNRWPLYACLAASWVWLATLMSGLHGRGVGFGLGMSGWSYLLIECRAIIHYLSLALWPAPLVFDYGVDLGTPGVIEALSALAIFALGIGTIVALRRAPAIGFLGAWFLITLAPTSSVVPIPLQPISENRIYVPTAAVLTGLAVMLHQLAGRHGVRASLVAALMFAGLTAARNRDYRSEIAIWVDTVAKRPDSSRAHSNLGHALQSVGRLAEARREHEIAIQIRPDYAEAHVNLASILGQLGQLDDAVAHSRRAAEIDPRNPNAFFNLGVALTQKGDVGGAITAYESAIRTGTASAETHCNLSLLLPRAGRVQDAIAHAETALRIKPESVLARFSHACALALAGRGAEAIPLFQDVVRAEPNHLEALQNLGTLLLQTGRPAEALVAFETAVRINPNHAGVRFGLGNALLNTGRVADAIREYESTLRLTPPSPDLHLNLGLALAQAGRAAEAAVHFETALRLNPQMKAAADGLARLRESGGVPRPR
jgi:tetratricopeptide (TPR) repeat protein